MTNSLTWISPHYCHH